MLSHTLNRLTDCVVPSSLRQDAEVFRLAKRVAAVDVVCLFWSALFAGIYALLGSWRSGLVVLLAVPTISCSLCGLKRGWSPVVCGNILCFAGWCSLSLLGLVAGGSAAPSLFWLTVLAVVAIHTAGATSCFVWTGMSLATIGLLVAAETLGVSFSQDVPQEHLKALYILVLSCLVICHCVLASVRVAGEQRAQAALREANRRLARSREARKTLEAGFGLTVGEWEKMKREKAALERLVGGRFDMMEESDDDDPATALTEAELDQLDADESDACPPTAVAIASPSIRTLQDLRPGPLL